MMWGRTVARRVGAIWCRPSALAQAGPRTDAEAAARPLREALAAADVASVRRWAEEVHAFFPKETARILVSVDQNRPVGLVRDQFRAALGEVKRLEAEIAARKAAQ